MKSGRIKNAQSLNIGNEKAIERGTGIIQVEGSSLRNRPRDVEGNRMAAISWISRRKGNSIMIGGGNIVNKWKQVETKKIAREEGPATRTRTRRLAKRKNQVLNYLVLFWKIPILFVVL